MKRRDADKREPKFKQHRPHRSAEKRRAIAESLTLKQAA